MFLHRVKMNWKKHQTLTLTILLVGLARIVLENGFGEAPVSVYAILQIGVRVLIAMAAWFGAVLVHPEPWTATRIIGRRLFVIGVLPLVFWVLIPAGLRAAHVSAAEIVSPLASAYGRRLAPPAFAILGVGVLLWIAGHVVGATAGNARRRGRGGVAPAAVPAAQIKTALS